MSTSTITRTAAEHLREPIVPATRAATQAFSTARKNPLALDATAAAAAEVQAVLAALRKSHPYEEPAFDLTVLAAPPTGAGTRPTGRRSASPSDSAAPGGA